MNYDDFFLFSSLLLNTIFLWQWGKVKSARCVVLNSFVSYLSLPFFYREMMVEVEYLYFLVIMAHFLMLLKIPLASKLKKRKAQRVSLYFFAFSLSLLALLKRTDQMESFKLFFWPSLLSFYVYCCFSFWSQHRQLLRFSLMALMASLLSLLHPLFSFIFLYFLFQFFSYFSLRLYLRRNG